MLEGERVSSITASNKLLTQELIETLVQRLRNFKKTKEELIKYIIRRTYRNSRLVLEPELKQEFEEL